VGLEVIAEGFRAGEDIVLPYSLQSVGPEADPSVQAVSQKVIFNPSTRR